MNRILIRRLSVSVSSAALATGLVLSGGGTALAPPGSDGNSTGGVGVNAGNIDVGGSQVNSAANGYGGKGGSGIDGLGLNYKNKVFGGSQINTSGKGVAGKSG